MESNKEFLSPKLKGKRFDGHALPLNLLEDFSVLEDLIFDLAKEIYLEEHLDRRRVPKGFTENVSLKLASIKEGSTIAKLILVTTIMASTMEKPIVDATTYIEKARDRVLEAMEDAGNSRANRIQLSPKYLNYFNRFGRNLLDDEVIEFINTSQRQIPFNKNTRRNLLLSRESKVEYSDTVTANALISKFDKVTNVFTIELDDNRFDVHIEDEFLESAVTAFEEYEDGTLVSIKATGIYNSSEKLIRIEDIDALDIVEKDPFDVHERLIAISKFDSKILPGGVAIDVDDLHKFRANFLGLYHKTLPTPAVFPSEGGNIQMEWEFPNKNGAILEINLRTLISVFTAFHGDESQPDIDILLSSEDGWKILNTHIRQLYGGFNSTT